MQDSKSTANDALLPEGLSGEDAARLKAEGRSNATNEKIGKSYLGIIIDNLLTFFNLVWAIVALLLIIFDSIGDMTFLAVVIPNVLIAIIQEIRAKRTVEKLSVTTAPKTSVVRDGKLITVDSDDVVLGDIIRIESGAQIPADAVVVSGLAEANESLLTGESNAVRKTEGDKLLAGSFLVSGGVFARVIAVGKDNYVYKIEKAARNFKAPASNLFRELDRLIKIIGIFMIPMSAVLFFVNMHSYDDVNLAVIKTCGSVIGMIPAGIYLLVTVTLTLSVITLSRKRTLVQDMYSIEMLASADVVCLDKTGTITDGTMCVVSFEAVADLGEEELARVIGIIEGAEESVNNTSRALIERFGEDRTATVTDRIPFSSERKYSAVAIEGLGCYSIGAPHFVKCEISPELEEKIGAHAERGERVLVLAKHETLGSEGCAVAIIAISDRIRPNAKETVEKFQEQGVRVIVISGDHAATVSSIARRVGIKGAENFISCESLTSEELEAAAESFSVFGRVTPEQKVLLVKKLRSLGHTVAMTGDGVNDTLALKESNCAIAMADGSEVARKISQIVLLDSDFGTLPDVVREGRRCINNVRQSATLFLMKTLFTISLSIISAITLAGYPFQPRQLMLLELFIIGISSVLLALEPNNKRIEGAFLKTVIIRSIPSALALLIPTVTLLVLGGMNIITDAERNSIGMLSITLVGLVNLAFICRPYTKWRALVAALAAVCVLLFIPLGLLVNDYFGMLVAFDKPAILTVSLLVSAAVASAIQLCYKRVAGTACFIFGKIFKKKA